MPGFQLPAPSFACAAVVYIGGGEPAATGEALSKLVGGGTLELSGRPLPSVLIPANKAPEPPDEVLVEVCHLPCFATWDGPKGARVLLDRGRGERVRHG